MSERTTTGSEFLDIGSNDGEEATLSVLEEVKDIIDERDGSGDPHEIHAHIAESWSWYLDMDIDGEDVAWLMALLKIARAQKTEAARDDERDAVGYTSIAASFSEVSD